MSFTQAGHFDTEIFAVDSHDVRWLPYSSANTASAAYPAANLAVYMPFNLSEPATVREGWVMDGTLTTSNVVQVAVYDTAGTRLWTTGDVTAATASAIVNSSGVSDVVLSPGVYYMAFGCDGTRNFASSALAIGLYQSCGAMEQTGLTGATLPATWTPVEFTRAYMPVFGLTLTSTAL